jgi:hypothetical protein
VVWNEVPENRVPLRCFAEERARPIFPDPGAAWRDVSPATPEFAASMRRAMEIYTRVRREGRAGPPVG